MDKEILKEAIKIIEQRRIEAERENELRYREINAGIPEVALINDRLFNTGRDFLKILSGDKSKVAERVEKLKQANFSAREIIRKKLVSNGYPEDYLQVKYHCPKCSDRAYVDGKKCSCLLEVYRKLSSEKLNNIVNFEKKTFESFELDFYKDTVRGRDAYTKMKHIYDYCLSYAENFTKQSESILMLGRTGLGKTHLSLSIANRVIAKGYGVVYDTAVNLISMIEKEHFGKNEDSTLTAVLYDADLLILDDLGTEMNTEFTRSQIFNIINTRLNRRCPTIINTNLDEEGIRNKYEERIVSRLFTQYKPLEFEGEDVRFLTARSY